MALQAARHVSPFHIFPCVAFNSSKVEVLQSIVILQVVNLQAAAPAASGSNDSPRQDISLEAPHQAGAKTPAPHASSTPGARRAESPDYMKMFRFEGHFEPPNNPDPPEQTPETVHKAHHAISAIPTEHSKGHQALQAVKAEPGAVQSGIEHKTAPVNSAQPADLLIAASGHAASQEASKSHAASHQRCESAFRRSHSPEWYDARFKQYVLR